MTLPPVPIPLPPWTEADLDEISMITEEDIEAARQQWFEDAPKRFKELLDAEPDDA